ncbi:MAG: polyhydroxyalkanoic acid system family protein [Gammaproteobacteria bacterium]|jgi:putative polyhydroxyalkanoate system protein
MAIIHIKRSHSLPPDAARAQVEKIARELKTRLNADYIWDGDSLKFSRVGASGAIVLGDGYIDLRLKLGLALSPMKGKIEKTILERIDDALDGNGDTRLT